MIFAIIDLNSLNILSSTIKHTSYNNIYHQKLRIYTTIAEQTWFYPSQDDWDTYHTSNSSTQPTYIRTQQQKAHQATENSMPILLIYKLLKKQKF